MESRTDVKHDELVSLRLEADLLDRLRKLARENERTVSAEVRLAVRAHLKAAEKAA